MRVIRQTSTELELRERPWLAWAIGPLFLGSGGYVALAGGELLFGGAFAAVGAVVLLAMGVTTTCTFDLEAGHFTRESRGLLGTQRDRYPLREIVAVRVAQGSGRTQTFRVELVRESGDRVPLTSAYGSGASDKQQTAETIRRFLKLTDTAELPIPGFGALMRMVVDPGGHQKEADATYGPLIDGYEAEIRRNPRNVEAYRNLAMALALQNRPGEARARLERLRELLTREGESATEIDALIDRIESLPAPRAPH